MSKLIQNDENGQAGVDAPALLPLSNSAVITHLKACQSLAVDHSRKVFQNYLNVLDEVLSADIERAKSNQDAVEIAELQRLFRQSRAELERYYCGYIAEGFVKFKKRELNTSYSNDLVGEDQLSLVENDDLEETIAISSITQRSDSYYAEPLWALNQRFAVLNGGEHVTEASNPASPIQFCNSLRRTLKLLRLTSKGKITAYKVYDDQVLIVTKLVSEGINQYLKSQGILPHLKYSLPTGSAPASGLAGDSDSEPTEAVLDNAADYDDNFASPDPNLPPEEYQMSLLHAIRGLQNRMQSSDDVVVNPGEVVVSATELVEVMKIMQGQNQQVPSTVDGQKLIPVDITQVVEQIKSQIKEQDQDAAVEKGDMKTIDLVGMVFEYMLNDENLPNNVKALLSYLHTPFLKIAFIDPGFFQQAEHPARLLLNHLAEAGTRWVSNDGVSQYDIYEKIKDTVNRVLKDFDNEIKVITNLLLEFRSYTKNIIRRQELMEKRATEKAQGEEKLREVKLKVNDEIRSRTKSKELPSAILLFLLQPWSDYLSFCLLRFGDKSSKWVKALAVVDDVLWCIEPKHNEEDKSRQREKHDDIVTSIEAGFEVIGFDQTKGKKLIDSVVTLMNLGLQSKCAEPAPAPMRDKLEKIAAEKAGNKEEGKEKCTPEEAEMIESLKMIEFGTWIEFEGGSRLKIAWYNARTSHYMLVDQMGKRVDMLSGLSLARKMIAGKVKIISGSSKPFFERALENIFHKLNEKAGAVHHGGESIAS